jgi:protocatechuate 3,4-dioxygenase alpha subunit
MRALVTRAYFQGEKLNETDPLLLSIEEPARRVTLIAKPDGVGTWRMDVRLQGGTGRRSFWTCKGGRSI